MTAHGVSVAKPDGPTRSRRRRAVLWRGMVLFATLAGLAIGIRNSGPFDADTVRVLAGAIGWPAFFVYTAYSVTVFGLLGAAWLTVMGQRLVALPAFAWARLLREAASDLLPFSQIGGIVVGADALITRGYPGSRVYAAITADLATEMASQAIFTVLAIGLTTAWVSAAGPLLMSTVLLGLAAVAILASLASSAPRWIPRIARALLRHVAPDSIANLDEMAECLRGMYADRGRLLLATGLNFAAWTASAAGAWIVLRSMGSDFPFLRTMALEAFIFALRSVAFMVPGGIGVQEAGYALVAPFLGLPIEQAVALAMVKRGKDLVISLPTLVAWQLLESRRLSRSVARTADPRPSGSARSSRSSRSSRATFR